MLHVYMENVVTLVQKPNSWTYNYLESSKTWGFWYGFLNHREGGIDFYQVFLLSPLQCTVAELQKL